jgi:hypothetical protein
MLSGTTTLVDFIEQHRLRRIGRARHLAICRVKIGLPSEVELMLPFASATASYVAVTFDVPL